MGVADHGYHKDCPSRLQGSCECSRHTFESKIIHCCVRSWLCTFDHLRKYNIRISHDQDQLTENVLPSHA